MPSPFERVHAHIVDIIRAWSARQPRFLPSPYTRPHFRQNLSRNRLLLGHHHMNMRLAYDGRPEIFAS